MHIKRYLAVILTLALGGLAGKAAAGGIDKENGDIIAQIHFVGTAQIANDRNAAKWNEIRALPESKALWDEIIQKLATTPFRLMNRNSPARTKDEAALIRPLMEDILTSETYLEMRGPSNVWPEVALAVKLDNTRAKIWRDNLAKVLKDWTDISVQDIHVAGFKGWELKKHHNPNVFRFVRAGDWVVFGWGQDELKLHSAILQKIKDSKRPVPAAEKYWLDASINWPEFMAYHPMALPLKLPKMELNVEGRSEFLRPELKLQFAEPLGLKLEPWRMPTNSIGDRLASITLARGFGPLLNGTAAISNLNAEPAPNEAVIWALPRLPFLTCAAAPVNDGSNYVMKIAPGLISLINSDFAAHNSMGKALLTTNMSVAISGLPFLAPFLRATNEVNGDFLVAGIFAFPPHAEVFPWEALSSIIGPDNVVYYGWEMGGERVLQWRAMSQLYFLVTRKPQPRLDTPAQSWIMAIRPKLSDCRTVGTLTAPNELTFVRNATVGLTGFELNCLALWVDGPGFPLGEEAAKATDNNAGASKPGGK